MNKTSIHKKATLVIGASSAIAQATIEQLLASDHRVIALSRQSLPQVLLPYLATDNFEWHQTEYHEAAIHRVSATLTENEVFEQIFICNGVLHGADFMPEKKVEAIAQISLQQVFDANTLTPLLWLQALIPALENYQQPCYITILSARIGSISDNALGGWYSYRMSKAALNMAVKTLAIECSRRAKQLKFILFHPGTTDTPLSKPFQRNVRPDKLFTPAFVALQLLTAKHQVAFDGQASYLDWQHKTIPW
ncbi:SDR family NAD(P)-dependent oxidoreductase [Thalassotalea euphylliae]|uniref:SDR family NAD(P)-dependent oxidoreductase n=1 Tax=Thalassotalea euphylliae TaxID=1655234 RepID=UPI002161BBEE|nr:SDR family NAD(P)-dependent oxidoreductase [Thalassotalea euphylliae]